VLEVLTTIGEWREGVVGRSTPCLMLAANNPRASAAARGRGQREVADPAYFGNKLGPHAALGR